MADMTIEALASKIDGLPPSVRLRLAAELLDAKRPKLAHAVAEKAVLELGAALALENLRKAGR